MRLKSIKDVNLKNKTVLVKADFNVPLKKENGKTIIANDTRIKLTIPTIQYLLSQNCKIILMSHLGRPKGEVVEKYRLDPIDNHLEKLLGQSVIKLDQVIGESVKEVIATAKNKQIILLENNRFEPGEKTNDTKLGKALASLADVFINDAFSVSHRAHASVVAVTKYLPSYAGFALQKEVEMLSKVTDEPKKPIVAIVGGAKISDKVDAIKNLTKIVDTVLVGGGVANNFLKAEGYDIYSSYIQDVVADKAKEDVDYVEFAQHLIEDTKQDKTLLDKYIPVPKIVYPIDVVAAEGPGKKSTIHTVDLLSEDLREKQSVMYLDIGPKTIKLFAEIISHAKTVFWNGPMGMFEEKEYEAGTKKVAKAIAASKATSILGGGDTITAIQQFKLEDEYTYVSASGGASLDFLGGKQLPGLVPLQP